MLDETLAIRDLGGGRPVTLELLAPEADRARLAERFDWVEVRRLAARLEAAAVAADTYDVTGRIEAAIVQRCRVTGNPVPEDLAVDVHERFLAAAGEAAAPEIDPLAVSVEVVRGGAIPVGEMVAQLVGLEAAAWPRAPAAAPGAAGGTKAGGTPDPGHPFASLAGMRKRP